MCAWKAIYVPGESACSGPVLLDRYEENKTMARNLAYLLPENLYRVFNETDKRKAAIADLWNEGRDLHRSLRRPSKDTKSSMLL
jgi:hypothetical protein